MPVAWFFGAAIVSFSLSYSLVCFEYNALLISVISSEYTKSEANMTRREQENDLLFCLTCLARFSSSAPYIDWNVREKVIYDPYTGWNVVLSEDYLKLTLFNEDLCYFFRLFCGMVYNHVVDNIGNSFLFSFVWFAFLRARHTIRNTQIIHIAKSKEKFLRVFVIYQLVIRYGFPFFFFVFNLICNWTTKYSTS